MLDVAFLILFCVMAVHIARSVFRETAVLREFNQSRALAGVALLFPLGPLVILAAAGQLGLVGAFLLGAVCYLPGLIVARRVGNALERAGTDRVKGARAAASQAFGTAMVGLIYVGAALVLALALTGI